MVRITRRARFTRKASAQSFPQIAGTFEGISRWNDTMYEKLGWLVVAKAKGYDYKIASYKKGLRHLIDTIDHVMTEYTDHNRKHDLSVIRMYAVTLRDFVAKHF